MTLASGLFGTSGGIPIGSIIRGRPNTSTWLPMDGGLYLKSAYPDLDTSDYLTFGTNTVQAATGDAGAITSFAHNADFSNMIVSGATSTTYRHSTNGGLTWTTRSIPGITNSISTLHFVNNLFVATGVSSSTPVLAFSSDAVTWTAGAAFGSNPNSLDFINGLYVAGISQSGSFGAYFGITTATSLAGPWTTRGAGVNTTSNAATVSTTGVSNNFKRSAAFVDGQLMFQHSQQLAGDVTAGHCFTPDGVNYAYQVGTGNAFQTYGSVSHYRNFRNSSWRIFLNRYALLPTAANSSSGIIVTGKATPFNSETYDGQFRNLSAASGSSGNLVGQLVVSESALLGIFRYFPVTGSPTFTNLSSVVTPSRAIFFSNVGIHYLNVDTTRFRLERPYIDGQFVSDAFVKAA